MVKKIGQMDGNILEVNNEQVDFVVCLFISVTTSVNDFSTVNSDQFSFLFIKPALTL